MITTIRGRPKIDITTIIRESFERTSPDNGPGDEEKVRGELKRRNRAIEAKENNKRPGARDKGGWKLRENELAEGSIGEI